MINAFHTHDQEYDCIHEPAVVHPMTTVQSAVLAHAGLQCFRPVAAGVFGVAAAVGKLAALDHAALMDTFGLAYAQAAGDMQAHVDGGPAPAQISCKHTPCHGPRRTRC